jgi:hypothetical protein
MTAEETLMSAIAWSAADTEQALRIWGEYQR